MSVLLCLIIFLDHGTGWFVLVWTGIACFIVFIIAIRRQKLR
jgi:hypothetical protein